MTIKKCCKHPFQSIQIQNNGEVYTCCCSWTDFYSLGNIFEQSFDDIWNGEKAQNLRQQFIDDNYKYCKLEHCSPYWDEFEPTLKVDYPISIELSYDWLCNVKCIFCRDSVYVEGMNSNQKFLEKIDETIIPLLKNAKRVYLNSAGELFASKHSMDLVKKISETYPNIQFDIISNGILFNEQNIKNLGLTNRIHTVIISLHAANEKTYNKIVEKGNFKKVIENVKYLSKLKKQGSLQCIQLNFVINSLNYKDIKQFAQLAIDVDARAFFIELHKPAEANISMEKLDITRTTHPEHKKFIKVFQDEIFDSPNCIINDYLKTLRSCK